MNTEHTIWFEKWRPTTIDQYVGEPLLLEKLTEYIANQDIPHLLFYGSAGTGKTTAAKILVNNIECDYLFINASDERGIDVVRDKIKSFASTVGFKPLKIVVLDEADYLGRDAQPALRNLMETYSLNTRFILTANYIERLIDPLISRTQVYKLLPPSKKEVAVRLSNILKGEGVEYDTTTVVKLVKSFYPDMRKIINTAQLQTKNGKLILIEDDTTSQNFRNKLIEILANKESLISKINSIRKLLSENKIRDFTDLYRELYDQIEVYAPSKIPETIVAIAEGQYRDGQVPDKEINFAATLSNILTA